MLWRTLINFVNLIPACRSDKLFFPAATNHTAGIKSAKQYLKMFLLHALKKKKSLCSSFLLVSQNALLRKWKYNNVFERMETAGCSIHSDSSGLLSFKSSGSWSDSFKALLQVKWNVHYFREMDLDRIQCKSKHTHTRIHTYMLWWESKVFSSVLKAHTESTRYDFFFSCHLFAIFCILFIECRRFRQIILQTSWVKHDGMETGNEREEGNVNTLWHIFTSLPKRFEQKQPQTGIMNFLNQSFYIYFNFQICNLGWRNADLNNKHFNQHLKIFFLVEELVEVNGQRNLLSFIGELLALSVWYW